MSALLPITTDELVFSTYAYSYPHKSSYRPLVPAVPIAQAWRDEDVNRLALYVHVPFCEMRCGFCNLFTQSQPVAGVVEAYLGTLHRQMRIVRSAVPKACFSQFAIGGGTPTFLTAPQLESLLAMVEQTLGQPVRELPTSVEASPSTVTPDRLRVLAAFGVRRVSLGIQSFVESETQLIGRPQRPDDVHRALERIREFGFPVLNIDLIYGHPRQSRDAWYESLRLALRYRPEEFYLYPLYVRPETGLARSGTAPPQLRGDLYQTARDLLGEQGYVQTSLRCFRLCGVEHPSTYTCQRDGMIGLGCGARSYTRQLHYATRFAVTQAGVRAILGEWIAQTDEELALATHGIWLSEEEQLRRYVIMSLLQSEGLVLAEFKQQFPDSSVEEISGVSSLIERDWLERTHEGIRLTPGGLEHSDTVGPLLYSDRVRDRLRVFTQLSKNEAPTF